MDPTDISSSMDKLLNKMGSLTFAWQPFQEKENSEFKPFKVHLKIDFVFYPARKEVVYI